MVCKKILESKMIYNEQFMQNYRLLGWSMTLDANDNVLPAPLVKFEYD